MSSITRSIDHHLRTAERLRELTDAPAGVQAWLDHTNYSMGLDDLDWVRGWVERAARDLRADEAEATSVGVA
jgi:hypothetical protein